MGKFYINTEIAEVITSDFIGVVEIAVPTTTSRAATHNRRRKMFLFKDPDGKVDAINACAYAKRNKLSLAMVYRALHWAGIKVRENGPCHHTGEHIRHNREERELIILGDRAEVV